MAIPSKDEIYRALEARHGVELQRKLSAASIAVCGLGGLGSNIAICLARAGIGRLHIIDFDKVDITNINRQQYFIEQIGRYKTAALYDTLKKTAPYCEIKSTCIKLTERNIPEILSSEDIICEAFDNAEAKAELVNCVLENMPEKYLVAASGMAGLFSANDIKTRRITKHFYLCGDEVNGTDISDAEASCTGLIASRVMICASHQAHKVLQIINDEL